MERTGLAGIFAASLELTKEGVLSVSQKKIFDELNVFEIRIDNNRLTIVRRIIKKKRPDKLKNLDTSGPNINALKKAAPIATPTIAIDTVLFFSAVLSDNRAIKTPEIAPAP